ncbi:DUF2513 domain-containing protein [uncultured Gilvimarinus sp.]|uniref:DUF2513 domain-containing protein n=1 Tax=uncultured Gilvimarinus sp. TaxID=1689143 RepID=UPI0030DAB765
MKKDADLIRRIVLKMASDEHNGALKGLEGVDAEKFADHAFLLDDDGYALTRDFSPTVGKRAIIERLTSKGHDFAAELEDDTLWNEVKEKVVKPGKNWSLGVLAAVLKAAAIKQITGF